MSISFIASLTTPIGLLKITGTDTAIESVLFADTPVEAFAIDHPLAIQCCSELKEYFDRQRTEFTLPLAPHGTPFQEAVWKELLRIPFGATRSYGDIARAVGDPNTIRAVGNANGRNPISIIIPCHRVIGANGSLTGYGGGLWRKQWLLEHESARTSPDLFS